MRRYDIVFAILLALSITDFALAAPVLVQEKRQPQADHVVHISKDVMTVLRKRGYDDILKMMEEGYLNLDAKPIDLSDTHASTSVQQPMPDHASTNPVEAPPPSTAEEPPTSWDPNNMPVSSSASEAPQMGWDPQNFMTPWSDDNSVGYDSEEGWMQLPKIEPKPKSDTDAFSSAWQSSAPNPASSESTALAKPDSSTEPSSPPWVQTSPTFLDPTWSDEEALGSGSGYTSDFEWLPKPKPNPT